MLQFPAYLASVRRLVCLAFVTTSLLVLSGATAYAQTLAPSTLDFTSHDQKTANDDMVQVITKNTAQTFTKERAPVITKKRLIRKEPVEPIAKESVRTFAAEPGRPMQPQSTAAVPRHASHCSFKTVEGKKESAPVISQYYPGRIVYPFAKVDRHIDQRLMQAATIAQERAHAHSRSMCWHYVKEALLASGVIDSRPKSELARDAAQELVNNYGFKRLSVTDPFSAPVGSVLVYGTARSVGHVEFRTR